ncbi:MAG TPA: hypothetical protein VN540_01760 [Clostridia bacterium]|nr:hypothetical protein [Clostridia bacterium]
MKKLTAILAAFALAFALLPAAALADMTLNVGAGQPYATIQSAVDAIAADAGTGTYEIVVKAGTYNETITIVQKENKNIIITGESGAIFKGNIVVDGTNRHMGTDTLTIQNLQVDKSGTTLASYVYIINLIKYAHNVTIQNCAFIGDDSGEYSFAIQAGSSGGNTAYNTIVRNCTFRQLDCVIQARCHGLLIENITTSDTNAGINANNSTNVTIKDSTINAVAPDYAVRLGENGGVTENINLVIMNSTLSCPGGDAIVFRASAVGNVSISDSDVIGGILNSTTNTVTVVIDNSYIQGTAVQTNYASFTITNPRTSLKGRDTIVTAGVDPTFTIIIPATINLGKLQKNTGLKSQAFAVEARDVVIEQGKRIDVSVAGDFKLACGAAELAYSLYNGATPAALVGNNEVFTSFAGARVETGSVQVDTANIQFAGTYQDTMTFTIAYH